MRSSSRRPYNERRSTKARPGGMAMPCSSSRMFGAAARAGRRLAQAESLLASIQLSPGEEDALRLYLTARADVVVSDDFDFLRKLRSLQVPMLTPAALLLDMVQEGALTKAEGLRLLEELSPHIAA